MTEFLSECLGLFSGVCDAMWTVPAFVFLLCVPLVLAGLNLFRLAVRAAR